MDLNLDILNNVSDQANMLQVAVSELVEEAVASGLKSQEIAEDLHRIDQGCTALANMCRIAEHRNAFPHDTSCEALIGDIHISNEGLVDAAKKIWTWIKETVGKIIDWIKSFFKGKENADTEANLKKIETIIAKPAFKTNKEASLARIAAKFKAAASTESTVEQHAQKLIYRPDEGFITVESMLAALKTAGSITPIYAKLASLLSEFTGVFKELSAMVARGNEEQMARKADDLIKLHEEMKRCVEVLEPIAQRLNQASDLTYSKTLEASGWLNVGGVRRVYAEFDQQLTSGMKILEQFKAASECMTNDSLDAVMKIENTQLRQKWVTGVQEACGCFKDVIQEINHALMLMQRYRKFASRVIKIVLSGLESAE